MRCEDGDGNEVGNCSISSMKIEVCYYNRHRLCIAQDMKVRYVLTVEFYIAIGLSIGLQLVVYDELLQKYKCYMKMGMGMRW